MERTCVFVGLARCRRLPSAIVAEVLVALPGSDGVGQDLRGSWRSSSGQDDMLPRWPSVGCGQGDHLSDMLHVRMSSRCEEVGRRTSELIISSRSATPARCTARRRRPVFGNIPEPAAPVACRAVSAPCSLPRRSPPPPAPSGRGRPRCPLRQHAAAICSRPDGRRKQSHRRSARMWARGVAPKRWTRCRLLRWPEAPLRARLAVLYIASPPNVETQLSRLSIDGFAQDWRQCSPIFGTWRETLGPSKAIFAPDEGQTVENQVGLTSNCVATHL